MSTANTLSNENMTVILFIPLTVGRRGAEGRSNVWGMSAVFWSDTFQFSLQNFVNFVIYS